MPDESKDAGKQQKCSGNPILCGCPECGGRKRKENEAKERQQKLGKALGA
jgi:predicted  nucleic acid-binding Zn-ribbon protein